MPAAAPANKPGLTSMAAGGAPCRVLPSPSMSCDFDRIISRDGTGSIKWNRYAGRDILPMWVADMDFTAPAAVLEALHRRVDHGIFGYSQPWPSLLEALQQYLEEEYGWAVEPEWIVWLPGLVTGLGVACRAASKAVFTATPIYPPFLSAPQEWGKTVATAPLRSTPTGWEWDFPAAGNVVREAGAGLFLLCHPHNPVGRAWTDDELSRLADLAEEHDLTVCSDEIHCDLVTAPGRRHRPFATISPEAGRRSITLMAPSKTFNLPGLGCSYAIIPDIGLRKRFRQAMGSIVPHVNVLGLAACEGALRYGKAWRQELIGYLRGNRERLQAAIAAMPGLGLAPAEATYLAWIETDLEHPVRFFEEAGVGLSAGKDFGPQKEWRRFVRLNFGCPRATLDRAIARMERAMATRSPTS